MPLNFRQPDDPKVRYYINMLAKLPRFRQPRVDDVVEASGIYGRIIRILEYDWRSDWENEGRKDPPLIKEYTQIPLEGRYTKTSLTIEVERFRSTREWLRAMRYYKGSLPRKCYYSTSTFTGTPIIQFEELQRFFERIEKTTEKILFCADTICPEIQMLAAVAYDLYDLIWRADISLFVTEGMLNAYHLTNEN